MREPNLPNGVEEENTEAREETLVEDQAGFSNRSSLLHL
jgi:hypothetical protein